jgi:polyhydroxyalkanoate synthase
MAQAEAAARATPPRQGPRPLPYHLGLAAASWLGWPSASPWSKPGSPGWNPQPPHRPPLPPSLAAELAAADPAGLAAALASEGRRRLGRLLDGIAAYRHHPWRRPPDSVPVLWQEGTTRLLDYGTGSGAPVLLVVPSLINRAYILDLTPETSLLRFLAAAGWRPLLVDWGAPGAAERGFGLTDYIAGRLEAALDAARAAGPGRPVLAGYCMGGLLAAALALRRPQDLAGLVLLATPWDFHAERPEQARMIGAAAAAFEPALTAMGELPVDLIQLLFAAIDPFQVIRKFLDFAGLDPASERARLFVALEDWLNDGVPLAAPVARECLAGWYGENSPARDAWRVAGRAVTPASLAMPALVVIPDRDRIVPPASALALVGRLPHAAVLRPPAGHIGMVVTGAPDRLRRPLLDWLRQAVA